MKGDQNTLNTLEFAKYIQNNFHINCALLDFYTSNDYRKIQFMRKSAE